MRTPPLPLSLASEGTQQLMVGSLDRLLCRGDSARAAQLLADLSFIPTESFRLQRCTEAVASLHVALAQRLPALLLAAAHALSAVGQVSF